MPESVERARALFPGAARRPYLNVAVRSLLAAPVRAAVDRFLDAAAYGGPDKPGLFAVVERGRAAFADWIGAGADEVAWTRNVTDGLNLFLGSLEWAPGDEVVLCPDLEHPANVLPWRNLAARRGVRLREIPADGGRMPVERMADAVGPRTRVIAAATISFSPGFVTDLAPLKEARRGRDALLVMDAAQSVGALRTDVDELGADALAVATQKALAGFYGAGFLYVRREVAESVAPPALGRFGVQAEGGETAVPENGLPYAAGARRFDLGNYNFIGAIAADAALALLARFGAGAIESRVRGLALDLAEGLLELGLPVAGGPPGDHLGHLVCVGPAGEGSLDGADDPLVREFARRLEAADVACSIRRGVVRFSPHLYNDAGDVGRALEVASGLVRRSSK